MRINKLIVGQGLVLEMSDEHLAAMIQDKYVSREGARSILGYIDRNITSGIADVVLADDSAKGRIIAKYSSELQKIELSLKPDSA
jgi:ATP-dependent Clp protease ATP-binding subunit ClpA